MIGIIDYGAGNLRSLSNAIERLGHEYMICDEPEKLRLIDKAILPGVGQFESAMKQLGLRGWPDPLRAWHRDGNPLLGICLGLHLMFDGSDEAPGVEGLGLLPGRCQKLTTEIVPHMGWNQLQTTTVEWEAFSNAYVYFAHSYAPVCERDSDVAAMAEIHGASFTVAVRRDNICAVQFHPEKSSRVGAEILDWMLTC
ncbi:MAG: imidazole glycerol phosphate synthase subunit HisH [Phycisphaerae bacterium]